MSIQSDAAKQHIFELLKFAYGASFEVEYKFHPERKWRFDFAVPDLLCANHGVFIRNTPLFYLVGVIELDGGTFQSARTGHTSGVGLRGWREKNNAAMTLGWRVWHYAPEEVIRAGRKTMLDEPVITRLPWL